jgi:hypothetical protein
MTTAAPLVAVIVAVPLALEVFFNDTATTETEVSDEAHITAAPAIGCPEASRTVAVTVAVSPSDVKRSVSVLSWIDVAT